VFIWYIFFWFWYHEARKIWQPWYICMRQKRQEPPLFPTDFEMGHLSIIKSEKLKNGPETMKLCRVKKASSSPFAKFKNFRDFLYDCCRPWKTRKEKKLFSLSFYTNFIKLLKVSFVWAWKRSQEFFLCVSHLEHQNKGKHISYENAVYLYLSRENASCLYFSYENNLYLYFSYENAMYFY
jgi:hypothetical protein